VDLGASRAAPQALALLDVDGFYAGLNGFLDHVDREGFLREAYRGMLLIDDDERAAASAGCGHQPAPSTCRSGLTRAEVGSARRTRNRPPRTNAAPSKVLVDLRVDARRGRTSTSSAGGSRSCRQCDGTLSIRWRHGDGRAGLNGACRARRATSSGLDDEDRLAHAHLAAARGDGPCANGASTYCR
jgi:hypothetical protein